jgi:hypothetical protein
MSSYFCISIIEVLKKVQNAPNIIKITLRSTSQRLEKYTLLRSEQATRSTSRQVQVGAA